MPRAPGQRAEHHRQVSARIKRPALGRAVLPQARNHVRHKDRGWHWRQGANPNAGAAARGAPLPLRPQGLQRQRHSHPGGRCGRLYLVVAECGDVPCAGLCDTADRYARCDVPFRDRSADSGAIACQAHGPACRRGADLVHLRRRRSLHATRSGARHLALGRLLGDRACGAAAGRQRRAGERDGAPCSGAAARRPRRVGAGSWRSTSPIT